MDALLRDAAERATRYLTNLDLRPVAPTAAAEARLAELGGELPAGTTDPRAVLALLDEIASPATVASAGGRYFGFVIGGTLPAALAASWLASAWDQNAFLTTTSPAAAALESIALRWLLELFGLPASAGGAFVTGATMANFSALAAARRALLLRAGWDVDENGLAGGPELRVVVGEEAHPTVRKALGLLGLGRARIVPVPVDGQGRMRAERLPRLDATTIVCGQAGNVNTGAFDPFREICAAACDAHAWVHVDGAFGLWALASPAHAERAAGVAEADSWATDAHKWLNVPYDSGLAFVRDAAALRGAMSLSAPYFPHGAAREPGDYTPDASRRARGVEVWAALRSLGRTGIADLVERTCRHASRFADALCDAGHEVLNDVVLNQVLVSFGDAARTRAVIARVQAEGTCWCGATEWQGRTAMRISVSSWATTHEDVERSIAAILRCADH
jgi:glutamate/tyrosine decarboxylase-like PLP-dependent enzyme